MSMRISDGSSSVVSESFPEESPPILHGDGAEAPCPRSSDLDGVARTPPGEVALPDPPVDPPPGDPATDHPIGVDLRLVVFRV
jgi:hypothetical protein